MDIDLSGKIAVVTGASGGIGRIIVSALLEKGAKVVMLSRNENNLKEAFEEIDKEKEQLSYKVGDVSNYEEVKAVFSSLESLDILINCAGILGPVGSLEENPIEDWFETIQINLLGTVNCCKAAIPLLKKSNRGKIINIAGGGSAYPRKFHTAYGTSKAAVVRFTETLAKELIQNVDVNVIAPGAHKTKMWTQETYDKEPEEWSDQNKLKELIIFLSSSNSDGITGKFIHILDDWKNFTPEISNSDLYTLRRIEK